MTLIIDCIASIEAECLKSCYQSHRRTCSVKHMNCNEMHSTGRQSRFFAPVRIFSYSQLHLYSSIIQKPPLFTSNAIISPATYLPPTLLSFFTDCEHFNTPCIHVWWIFTFVAEWILVESQMSTIFVKISHSLCWYSWTLVVVHARLISLKQLLCMKPFDDSCPYWFIFYFTFITFLIWRLDVQRVWHIVPRNILL